MKLIAGLGNPGNQYHFTRHNTGFLVLDYYFETHQLNWEAKPRLGAIWGRTADVIFIKPQDFYNDSGKAISAYAGYYKLDLSDILVICDDFNLDFGTFRYRASGSAGGNNGLKSTIAELKTKNFARLRVGTGNDALRTKIGDVDFVLSKFTPEEKSQLPETVEHVIARMEDWL